MRRRGIVKRGYTPHCKGCIAIHIQGATKGTAMSAASGRRHRRVDTADKPRNAKIARYIERQHSATSGIEAP